MKNYEVIFFPIGYSSTVLLSLKKVIKQAIKKGYRDMKRREKREYSFFAIPDYE
ncbi:hypothetical protein PV526_07870 [Clostridioides difficile]|nr:hypothetical protein [Clostridioides difficile]